MFSLFSVRRILFILFVLMSFCLLGQPLTTKAAPIISNSQSSNSATPSSWLTYTNEKFGYSFEYPAAWTLRETNFTGSLESVTLKAPRGTNSLNFYVDANWQGKISQPSNFLLAGITGVRHSYLGGQNPSQEWVSIEREGIVYSFQFIHGSKWKNAQFQNILSTFHFLDTPFKKGAILTGQLKTEGRLSPTVNCSIDPSSHGKPTWGTALRTFNGETSYSNGGNINNCQQGTYGLMYQCVELVQRYFARKWGYANVWGGNAQDLMSTAPSGIVRTYNGNSPAPVAGDAIVFDGGGFGHTAIITRVQSGRVYLIEQNWDDSTNEYSITIDSNNNLGNHGSYTTKGWLHAPQNGTGGQTGDVGGFVKNRNTNAAISGASVHADRGGTTETTDSSGRYTLHNVPIGTTNVTASANGFDSNSVSLNVNANASNPASDILLSPNTCSAAGFGQSCPGDGISFCDNSNFGAPCHTYTYSSNDQCINMGDMDNKSNSVKFLGSYVGNYDAVMYGDTGCGTYNARYDHDVSDFGLLNNNFSSLRIERHGPSGGIDLCDGSNYGSPCRNFTWNGNNNACISLGDMDNKANSIRFNGNYVGNYDAIMYGDTGCGVYNARYDHNVSDFGLQNDNFSSMRIEQHQPPQPPGAPHDPNPANSASLGTGTTVVDVSFQADGDQFRIHAWGPNYDRWIDWSGNRSGHLDGLTGQSYSWQAQARNSIGESPWSDTWSFSIPAPPQPPAVPSNLRASGTTRVSVSLAWDDVANETGYKIYKWGYDGSEWEFLYLASTDANTTSYSDTGLQCASDYFYQVSSYNDHGESAHADWIKTTTQSCPLIPNDEIVNATLIPNSPYTVTQDTTNATAAADDPTYTCGSTDKGAASVWFRFTPGVSGTLNANTIGSTYDTMLAVWSGTRGHLTSVRCDDDAGGNTTSLVSNVPLTGGTTYYIEVARYAADAAANRKPARLESGGGSLALGVNFTSVTCYTLTVPVNPTVGGSVSKSPAPNCNNGTQYTSGTNVTLTAVANGGFRFKNWSGSASGTGTSTSVTMNSNKSVTANFEAVPCYTLTVTVNPSAGGSVTRNPAPNCNNGTGYSAGTVVSLTAVPNSGYIFTGWSGGAAGTSNPVSITMNTAQSVAAAFSQPNTKPPVPTLLTPKNSKTCAAACTLDWTDSPGATYYVVQVRVGTASGTLVVNQKPKVSSFKTAALAKGKWYFWKVKACNAANQCSVFTGVWKYKVN